MSSKANDQIYIALGGNVGAVRDTFRAVLSRDFPEQGLTPLETSSAYRTRALTLDPDEHQDDYWNAVVRVHSELAPGELMRCLIGIEDAYGRARDRRWAPRTLDLDLLLHGDTELEGAVVVPHPRLTERAFVLVPLVEIAPELVLPNGGSIRKALDRLGRAVEGEILERDGSFP